LLWSKPAGASFFFLLEHLYRHSTIQSGVVFSFYLQFPEGMPIAPASARFNFRQEQTL
jgi:hypothetical protein